MAPDKAGLEKRPQFLGCPGLPSLLVDKKGLAYVWVGACGCVGGGRVLPSCLHYFIRAPVSVVWSPAQTPTLIP